jgi:hypothetical protein
VTWPGLGGDICDLQEPRLLQRRAAVGDLLRTLDQGVDGLVVVLLALELPLAGHPPDPGGLARAHLPGRLQDLAVGEVVAVPFEVPGQVVGGLGDPRADDEPEPGVLQRVQVRRREHPGVSDHDHVPHARALRERAQHGDQGGGLGLAALEQVHLEREPGRARQEPGLDLRAGPVLLAHPDLAQFVLIPTLRSSSSSSRSKCSVVTSQGTKAAVPPVRAECAQAAVASCPR